LPTIWQGSSPEHRGNAIVNVMSLHQVVVTIDHAGHAIEKTQKNPVLVPTVDVEIQSPD
jgi:hypothetical protein